jgi:hypothetical protein
VLGATVPESRRFLNIPEENPVRMSPVTLVAAVVLGAAFLPACHHSSAPAASNDAAQPIYRKADADFSKYQVVKLHFVSVTTNNNEGTDIVHTVFEDSLKKVLSPHFKTVETGDTAGPGELLMDIDLRMNWGNRGARIFVGWGAGKVGIEMKYNVKDGATTLASFDKQDQYSGGGDSRALVFAAADKWNPWFTNNVLFPTAAPAKK